MICFMSRENILAKVSKALEAVTEKISYPSYDVDVLLSQPKLQGDSLMTIFSKNFQAVSGKTMHTLPELIAFLKQNNHHTGYCDPALYEQVGKELAAAGLTVETTYDRLQYDRYQFGITRATAAIAESGSLILDDLRSSDRLAALSPWVHVALLAPHQIHRSIPDAIAALDQAPNIIWVTGPSKTADVEGILIEGVHGPGEQIALILG